MNGRRKSNSMVVDRPSIHGNDSARYGVLRCLDAHLVRGGPMKEAIIISVILIIAVLLWSPPRKGGKR